jgi:hypothetical protein
MISDEGGRTPARARFNSPNKDACGIQTGDAVPEEHQQADEPRNLAEKCAECDAFWA